MHLVRDRQSYVGALLALFAAMIVLAVTSPLPNVKDPDTRELVSLRRRPDVSALAPAATVEKRVLFYHNYLAFRGYTVYYSVFNSILPVAAAASSLLDFYVTIAENAGPTGGWRRFVPPTGHFGTSYGFYDLEFFCENRQISWSVIHDFAYFMAHLTNRGLVGTYTALISFAAEEVELYVVLRVREG
ncbi:MAG: hypothetical protein Q9191_001829 [Dirinaria sp. TL-2023a]